MSEEGHPDAGTPAADGGGARAPLDAVTLLGRIARVAGSRTGATDLARAALPPLVAALGADGATLYGVEGDELVEWAHVLHPGSPPPPPRLPLGGTFNSMLLAAPGARQWTLDEAPERVRALIAGPPSVVVASAAIPSGGRSMGVIHLVRMGGARFSEAELQLLAIAAAQLGPAFELAVREEGGEAQGAGRELSVLHRIAAATGRSLELSAVVASCIELTRELTAADYVTLYLYEGKRLVLAGGEPVPGALSLATLPASAVEHVTRARRPSIGRVTDLREPYRAACIAAGVRMTLSLPLLAGDVMVGMLALGFTSERRLGGSTLDTLTAMAEQEAVAIDYARSQQLAQMQARLSTVLREVAERALAATTDVQTYEALLDGACRVTGGASARLALFDPEGALRTIHTRNLPVALSSLPPLDRDDPFVARVRAAAGPLVYETPERLDSGSPWADAFRATPLRSLAVMPLRLRGELVGLISAHAEASRRFHEEEYAAMALLASVGASAIDSRRQRRAAEEQRARMGEILEHLPQPVVVLDRAGRFEQVNAAYRAMNPAAVVGRSWFDVIDVMEARDHAGRPLASSELAVARVLRGEPTSVSDLRLKTANAGVRNLVTLAAPLHDEAGELAGLVVAVQDVTALRELADAKDRFLDIASHELRSPLSALRACTSLLEIDPTAITNEARRHQLTGRIFQQVDRLVLLVDELVDMARIRGGTLHLSRSRIDLVELARELAELAQLQSDRHRIAVQAEAPVIGLWDRQRLAQVLTNLLSNAVRYSPKGGEVVVRAAWQGPELAALSVEDQGIGITTEERARLFEPYFRGSSANQVARNGLGLGLHISMEIARHHQGRIEVESEPGRGSRFTLLLPREA